MSESPGTPDGVGSRRSTHNLEATVGFDLRPAPHATLELGAMARVTQEFDVRDRFEGALFTGGLNYLIGRDPVHPSGTNPERLHPEHRRVVV